MICNFVVVLCSIPRSSRRHGNADQDPQVQHRSAVQRAGAAAGRGHGRSRSKDETDHADERSVDDRRNRKYRALLGESGRRSFAFVRLQKYKTELKDLEHLGELGSGTCGHVVRMLHKPSNTEIAVKVSSVFEWHDREALYQTSIIS